MKAGTLIYTHGGGQLGNQVLRFAHWLAWALERAGEIEVRNLAFWPYAKYFATWQAHPGCVFPLRPDAWDEVARGLQLLPGWARHRLDWRVQHQVHALGRRRAGWQAISLNDAAIETLDLGDPAFNRKIYCGVATTCAGWRISGWEKFGQHQDAVRRLLQPARDFASAAADFTGGLRRHHGFIIGVHLRQGDYRAWLDGRFLFSTSQYARWIREALDLHAARNPAVVVVSDAPLDDSLGQNQPVYRVSASHEMTDWTVLSRCDVILGPPSTFSATAAFVGGRPLWPVVSRDQVLDRSQLISDGLPGVARHPEFGLAVK